MIDDKTMIRKLSIRCENLRQRFLREMEEISSIKEENANLRNALHDVENAYDEVACLHTQNALLEKIIRYRNAEMKLWKCFKDKLVGSSDLMAGTVNLKTAHLDELEKTAYCREQAELLRQSLTAHLKITE